MASAAEVLTQVIYVIALFACTELDFLELSGTSYSPISLSIVPPESGMFGLLVLSCSSGMIIKCN